jgi:hypothetical protein
MRRLFLLTALVLMPPLAAPALAQHVPFNHSLSGSSAAFDSRPLSNSAVDLLIRGDSVWVAGGKGMDLTFDGGATWRHLGSEAPFALEDVAAVGAAGSTMWMSLAGDTVIQSTTLPLGRGLALSTDNGATWRRIAQPQEAAGDTAFFVTYGANRLKALAITTIINNLTYDLAVTSRAVWTANFAGGLRRSTDGGATFELLVLPPDNLDSISVDDTLDFDLTPVDRPDFWNRAGTRLGMRENLNHRVFSIFAENDSTIWVGTAGGVNRTTDNGRSWRKFNHNNQARSISGNFVVAIGKNRVDGRDCIWAATINALDAQEFRAVSVTSDGGATWSTVLRGEFTHNFGFQDSIAYAATNSGIFRSDDGGATWSQYGTFVDAATRARATESRCYAAASQGSTVWVASSDGLMKTVDSPTQPFGSAWTIFRAAQSPASASDVYAYPNPFSPDDEVCRIHYRNGATGSVSMTVYDFAMYPVRTIIRNAARPPQAELDEIWDGKDDSGRQAANGLYYIQVTRGDDDPAWAKVIVLQ